MIQTDIFIKIARAMTTQLILSQTTMSRERKKMKLGERMDVVAFTLKGDCSKFGAIKLVEGIIKTLKMHKAHEAVSYQYPLADGEGGLGFTYIQPITESFIAFDAWPDFKGVYLVICSCKTVNLNAVSKKIRASGYTIKQVKANELRLKNGF